MKDDTETNPSSVTREDLIEVSPSGLITVIGGKLTTARLMAGRVLKYIRGSHKRTPCQTHKLPIGGTNEEIAEGYSYWVRQCPQLQRYFLILYRRYGIDAHEICAIAMKHFLSGAAPFEIAEAELEYVCRNEMPCTLEDLIERRVGFLHWNNVKRLEQLRHMKGVIRKELDMDEGRFEQGYHDYQEYLKRFHTVP